MQRLCNPILARLALACLTLSGLLLSTACVTVKEPAQVTDVKLRQSSVVSTSSANFKPQKGDTVSWQGGISVHAPDGVDITDNLVADLKAKIDKQLVAKGYVFTPQGLAPDYLIHGVIVVGNELNEKQLRDVLGFEPGLVATNQKYEKGSLLLLLVNPNSYSTDWRGVVQVFTAPGLTEQERDQRFDYIIRSLLRPLPNLNASAN
jgi:hypothetical protein